MPSSWPAIRASTTRSAASRPNACTRCGPLAAALAAHRPEAVIHFAAKAYVGESMSDPATYFRVITVGSLNLLDAMLAAEVRDLVFSSTCATYGVPERTLISEQSPQRPVNPYGQSKLMVEDLLRWYGELYGLRWAALRYFNVAGSDPTGRIGEIHDPETHLIPRAILAVLGEVPPLQIFGTDYPTADGTAIRDYNYVVDLCRAHLAALDAIAADRGPVVANLGTGRGASVREVIDSVSRISARSVPHEEAPRRAGDPPELVADPSLARRILHWEPDHPTLDAMVEHAWRWLSKGRLDVRAPAWTSHLP